MRLTCIYTVESASETERAVGRLIGSLCAITAKDEEAESAMLASWISQVCRSLFPGIDYSLSALNLDDMPRTIQIAKTSFVTILHAISRAKAQTQNVGYLKMNQHLALILAFLWDCSTKYLAVYSVDVVEFLKAFGKACIVYLPSKYLYLLHYP